MDTESTARTPPGGYSGATPRGGSRARPQRFRRRRPAITAIYNDAVENTTAIWNDRTVSEENRRLWLADHEARGFPVLVAVEDGPDPGEVLGYATFGDWRAFDGYRHTVEHSVYVRSDQRGRGLGRLLMVAIMERARALGKHVMVAGIDAGNTGSVRLHEKLGFRQVGLLPEVGTKFGRWLDLAFMQFVFEDRAPADHDAATGSGEEPAGN